MANEGSEGKLTEENFFTCKLCVESFQFFVYFTPSHLALVILCSNISIVYTDFGSWGNNLSLMGMKGVFEADDFKGK